MIKKLVLLLCVIAAICCGCTSRHGNTYEEPRSVTHNVYETALTAKELSNDSVGNEWKIVYTCEGQTIHSGERWTIPFNTVKTVEISIIITEQEKYPDVGCERMSVTLANGFETSTIITVTEDKGQYKGNEAQWAVTCQVTLVKQWKE